MSGRKQDYCCLHGILQEGAVTCGSRVEVGADRCLSLFAPVLLHENLSMESKKTGEIKQKPEKTTVKYEKQKHLK